MGLRWVSGFTMGFWIHGICFDSQWTFWIHDVFVGFTTLRFTMVSVFTMDSWIHDGFTTNFWIHNGFLDLSKYMPVMLFSGLPLSTIVVSQGSGSSDKKNRGQRHPSPPSSQPLVFLVWGDWQTEKMHILLAEDGHLFWHVCDSKTCFKETVSGTWLQILTFRLIISRFTRLSG